MIDSYTAKAHRAQTFAIPMQLACIYSIQPSVYCKEVCTMSVFQVTLLLDYHLTRNSGLSTCLNLYKKKYFCES